MMGDAALMCGYCPTTGKIMAKKKQGGKMFQNILKITVLEVGDYKCR